MTLPPKKRYTGFSGILVAVSMFILAGFFLWGPDYNDIPDTQASVVNTAFLTSEPRRTALGDPPIMHLNGFNRNCMDCHKLFPPRLNPPTSLLMHSHIVLDHGINDQCRNCHDLNDRDRLVLSNNNTISFSDSVKLCASCHGPTYRDWEKGMHGRSSGYWDTVIGLLKRLDCVECHDPHKPRAPAMLPMPSMPGPHTLRMGEPIETHHGDSEDDPLRKAILREIRK